MSADKLCRRVYNDIRSMLDRTYQIRCGKCRIHDKRDLMPVSNPCKSFQIRHVGIRISQRFYKNCFCIFLNRPFKCALFFRIHKCCRDPACKRQRMSQKIVGASIYGLGSDNMLSGFRQRLKRISNGRCSRSCCKSCRAALQSRYPLFKCIFRGIGHSPVYVSRILQSETVRRVLTVIKHIGCGRIDRNRSCSGRRIRLLLSDMYLFCFKAPVL